MITYVSLDHIALLASENQDLEHIGFRREARSTLSIDPRIEAMPKPIGRAILTLFDGDVDEAKYQALRLSTRRNPPAWAAYLNAN